MNMWKDTSNNSLEDDVITEVGLCLFASATI